MNILAGKIFEQPPYRSDLSSSDFHLILKLKEFVGRTYFQSDNKLEETVTERWLEMSTTMKYEN